MSALNVERTAPFHCTISIPPWRTAAPGGFDLLRCLVVNIRVAPPDELHSQLVQLREVVAGVRDLQANCHDQLQGSHFVLYNLRRQLFASNRHAWIATLDDGQTEADMT